MFTGFRFGQWDWIVPVVGELVKAGSTVASGLIQKDTATRVAEIQAKSSAQLAELELKRQQYLASLYPAATAQAGIIPTVTLPGVPQTIGGIPTLYLLIGGGVILILLMRR